MQGLNRTMRRLSERQTGTVISVGHPRRQTPSRAVGQRDDKELFTISPMTAMHWYCLAEQRVPRIANRDGARNVSSL
jgi:hypothetical protein